ncbi:uncharacterized protein LDX57_001659 [Aspergillus melleus]|uniref:uncharacterized protein n=1 Tax=Aspergillus melleus TaxID=138277 RepID=UPI001E8D1F93|nr:uncharacterized protein LDX57_001659 [Aspergillus melleus]KAH8423907.1 hypothetical protein LDX57_001659 [Aspergillus melleus]
MDTMLVSVLVAVALLLVSWVLPKRKSTVAKYPDPPIIPFSSEEIIRNPHECFMYGFRHYGQVFRYYGNGSVSCSSTLLAFLLIAIQYRYMVSKELTERVLTDDTTFSFELGVAKALKINLVSCFHRGTFHSDVDAIVTEVTVKRLKSIIPKISPIFQRNAAELVQMHGNEPFDPLPYLQKTVAEAIAVIIFGDEIARTCNPDLIVNIAEGVAKATGMFQNQSSWGRKFPTLYSFYSWTELILFHLIWRFGREMGPTVWTALSKLSSSPRDSKDADDTNSTVLAVLARKLASKPGHLSIASKIWAITLSLAFIFASVHQTVVIMTYVVFELARHPECQESIVLTDLSPSSPVTVDSLRDAIHAESFIREVLRMKGEAITTVRSPRHDLELAGYFIPKGSLLQPMVYPSNRSPEYTTNPDTFDGMRWTQNRKLATTTGPGHLSFGLGRWACPGRFLAVAEIKLVILTLLAQADLELVDGEFTLADKLNIVGTPPRGRMVMKRRLRTGTSGGRVN